jgi:hypothetical protein
MKKEYMHVNEFTHKSLILLTGFLSTVNNMEMSVVDNIGPRLLRCF